MAKNISKIKGKKGITLVECVVAIAIFAIMSLLAYRGFTTGFNNIKKGDDNVTAANNSTVAFSRAKAGNLAAGNYNCKTKGYGVPGTLKVESGTMDLTDGKVVHGYWYTYTENGYTFRSFVPSDK
ncbi:MAG TPA: hypothetical protein DEQ88_00485 [Clostridiales bacterium]|nr:hypothetical protein [Clostridiales bacterium]